MEYSDKKAETALMLANINSKYTLVSGRSYTVTKTSEGIVIA